MAKDLKLTVNDLIANKENVIIKPENYITRNWSMQKDIIKELEKTRTGS
jgi:uncharacterized protein